MDSRLKHCQPNDNLALGAALLDVGQGLIGLLKREDAIYDRADFARFDERCDFGQLLPIGRHEQERISDTCAFGPPPAEHRDNPGKGCASAALLPEIAREPVETRQVYAEHLLKLVRQVAAELTPDARDPEAVAFGVFATLIGTLELSRAVNGTELSDRILEAGAIAAKALLQPRENDSPAEREPS